MRMSEWRSKQTVILRVEEPRLDAMNAPHLRSTLLRFIELGMTRIILDLREVGFMDSSALGACITGAQRIGPLGQVVLAGARGEVSRLFELTHMHRVFRVYESLADAVRADDSLVSVSNERLARPAE